MMTCKELCALLLEFVSGELSDECRAVVEQHLKDCPPCLVYFETYQVTIKLVRKLPCATPPPQLMDRLRAALEDIKKEGK